MQTDRKSEEENLERDLEGEEADRLDDDTDDHDDEDENSSGESDSDGDEESSGEVDIHLDGEEVDDRKTDRMARMEHGFRKRIAKIREREEAYKKQIAEMQAAQGRTQPNAGVPQRLQGQLPPPPQLKQFDYDEGKYQQAMAQYMNMITQRNLAVMSQQRELEQRQESQRKAMQEAAVGHYDRAKKLGVRNFEAVEENARIILGDTLTDAIIAEVDDSEKLLYFLGLDRNAAKAEEIAATYAKSPVRATLEIGRLSARLRVGQKERHKPNPDKVPQGTKTASSGQKYLDRLAQQVADGKISMSDYRKKLREHKAKA